LINDQTGATTIADCVIDDGYSSFTLNGTISFFPAGSGYSFTANLSFSQNGNTESITGSGTCDAQFNCSMTASFTGIDGRTYTTTSMSVTGDNTSGYTVSGTITDPDHGNITLATNTPVTFNCADGRPDAGQITVTGGSSATVVFNECSSFSITFDGSTTAYNWADF
ncbi:MAG: hypothetical protein OQK76_04345, partial [Gammaproteobacteria bacterium]|nr:hypothetical protein [Gammaproteobacteria bacterium]